ncbi:MAG: ABC transporter ATP-binding protein [Candidatus Omnitrophica bacterium]|nr:ABC transporter ATP-binding protein [Candidatus Omnitrophota bacterium]
MGDDLLSVRGLNVRLSETGRMLLREVSLDVTAGSVVAVVGGSGSGKTTLGNALLGILPPAMELAGGEILFQGRDIGKLKSDELRRIRGRHIGMVFQEPVSALDPVYKIGFQIIETLQAHGLCAGESARLRARELLQLCGVPDPQRIAESYPFELSGGLRQRAMIALAIAAGPSLVIADEPTSSLDVVLQARVIELFRDLRKRLGLSLLLITHDLGVARALADELVVMCQGEIVERGPAVEIFSRPVHPYTRELVAAEDL